MSQLRQIIDTAMAVYASESGVNIRVKLVWVNTRCPRQPGGTECGYYVMKLMKEIAYEGFEILDNDNISWERSRGILGCGYGWHSCRLVDLCG
ncbi:putative papain-like cysteine peptidase superfamily [Helianthus annuus]|nr:putative papain-like cysteine peptidase superfamily [Helianthus annuus]KAJ0459639.1 putative papain-like cysteine peptidase superfamily [Helianthus annuus]